MVGQRHGIRDGIRVLESRDASGPHCGLTTRQPPLDLAPGTRHLRDLSRGLEVISWSVLSDRVAEVGGEQPAPRPLHAEQRRDPIGSDTGDLLHQSRLEGLRGCVLLEPGPSPGDRHLEDDRPEPHQVLLDGSGHVGLCSNPGVRLGAPAPRAPQGWQVTLSRGVHGSEYAAVRPIAQATQHPPLPPADCCPSLTTIARSGGNP